MSVNLLDFITKKEEKKIVAFLVPKSQKPIDLYFCFVSFLFFFFLLSLGLKFNLEPSLPNTGPWFSHSQRFFSNSETPWTALLRSPLDIRKSILLPQLSKVLRLQLCPTMPN